MPQRDAPGDVNANGADAGDSDDSLGELARLFLKLGCLAFGGPAAHVAMLEDEVVRRRKWLTRRHFLDLIGATHLIPGPNSAEMALHVGYERAGGRGLLTAGACFIAPAVTVAGLLAWGYVEYGTMPAVEPFLRGIKPAILAIILAAAWRLGRSAVTDWRMALTGVAVASLVLGDATGEITALLVGGAVGGLWRRFTGPAAEGEPGGKGSSTAARFLPVLFSKRTALQPAAPDSMPQPSGPVFRAPPGAGEAAAAAGAATAAGAVSLWKLGVFFLKVGSVLYGSGYVLVAFLQGELVEGRGWLTQAQLLDAVAIGQLAPGTGLSTATVVGLVVAGVGGAAVATLGIFLPSFAFTSLLNPLVPRLRDSAWLSAVLDAVSVSAVGLLVAVTVQMGAEVLTAWPAWMIAALAVGGLLLFRLNAAWLVLAGAALGGLFQVLGMGF